MTDNKICPYCAEEIRQEAVKCRFCGSRLDGNVLAEEWTRSYEDKMIAGVCAGLAAHFDISVTLLRLAFVLMCVFGGGAGALVYLILWMIMPMERGLRRRDFDADSPGDDPAPFDRRLG
jgi:phage shock protein PspC (stress-responsive transcriptional regulator)